MANSLSDDRKKTFFLWGSIFAWTPFIPPMIGMLNAFKGISEQKATGVGAAAGGIAGGYAALGVICSFVLPVAAIVLLVKSFDAGHRMRTVFSLLFIGWSLLALVLVGFSVWMSLIYLPHSRVISR